MITICLHRGNSWVGMCIRVFTRSYYSHASVILSDGTFVEAREFKGVRWLDEFVAAPGETVDYFTVDLTPEQERGIEEFLIAQAGKPYDWPMVFGFVSRSPYEGHESEGKWFCSELVFAAFKSVGIDLLRAIEAWKVSPGLLGLSTLIKPCAKPPRNTDECVPAVV